MTLDELLAHIEEQKAPASEFALTAFERELNVDLPEAYRDFLLRSNGGHVGGIIWYSGVRADGDIGGPGINTLFGLDGGPHGSLRDHHKACHGTPLRVPRELLVIGDDPFGNLICLGIAGPHRGHVFFYDQVNEPVAGLWDGQIETAGNLDLITESFCDFLGGLEPIDEAIQNPLR